MNPDIFIIRDIFRTLEYSKVRRYLDTCQIYCKKWDLLGKKFHAIIIFAGRFSLNHIRCLAEFQMSLCIYKCYLACTVVLGSVSGISDIFEHYSKAR